MNTPGVETQRPGIEAAKTIKVFLSVSLYVTDITWRMQSQNQTSGYLALSLLTFASRQEEYLQ
jgi:hypothetical protein